MPRSTKGSLIHQEQIEPKKYLLSKRLDLTKYQYEHSWDFFDALNNTKEAIIARKNNETSIKGNNLDKYLSITRTLETQKNKVIEEKKNNIIPEPFNKLLKLQHFNGSFESLSDVKQVLFLPNSIEYIRNNNYNEIEKATALAIAAMRQEYKLFNLLVDSHDKACKWITTNELVYEAREIIVKYQFTGEYSNENYGNSCRNSKCISPLNSNNNNNNSYNNNSDTTINQENPNNEEYHSNSNDNIIQIDSPVSNNHSYKVTDYNISETNDVHDVGAAFSRKEKSKMLEISTTIPQHSRNKNLSRIRNTSRQKSQSPIKSHKYKSQRSVGKYSDSIALKPIVSGDNDSPRSTSSSNSQYSALSQQLQKLTISRDEAKIARHKQYMDQIQVLFLSADCTIY